MKITQFSLETRPQKKIPFCTVFDICSLWEYRFCVIHSPSSAQANLASPRAGRVALRGFFAICDLWKLSSTEQMTLLGGLPKSTYHAYRKLPEVSLGRDLLERISLVMGIFKALEILFQNQEQAHQWVHQPNTAPPFHGQSALERMKGGSLLDLAAVRQSLDSQRGW